MSDARIRVLVLFGGRSSEHAISCLSAASVLAALDPQRFEAVTVGITRSGAWVRHDGDPASLRLADGVLPEVAPHDDSATISLDPQQPGVWFETDGVRTFEPVDVIFPVLHGPFGEDGTIQGLAASSGIPCVGSGVLASAACMDKVTTKRLLAADGIPAGRWVALTHDQWQAGDARVHRAIEALGYPLFVKPARAGSSMGVAKVDRAADLDKAIAAAADHDHQLIVEAAVVGAREIECGVLTGRDGRPRASVSAEIVVRSGHDFYDFAAKYLDDSVDLIVPADVSPDLAARIRELALAAFAALGCAGLARIDFFVDEAGDVLINEINTMPGFTAISMYPRMWQASGVTYPELISTLVDEALSRSER